MSDTARKLVFIADDDPDIVEAVRTVLEATGFDVDSAPNGQECLRKIRLRKPDVLILDVMMTTETEGFHVAYEIRRDPTLRDIPILMLTAIEQKSGFKFSPSQDEDYLPVEAFIAKPVEPDELVSRVKQLLAKAPPTGQ